MFIIFIPSSKEFLTFESRPKKLFCLKNDNNISPTFIIESIFSSFSLLAISVFIFSMVSFSICLTFISYFKFIFSVFNFNFSLLFLITFFLPYFLFLPRNLGTKSVLLYSDSFLILYSIV